MIGKQMILTINLMFSVFTCFVETCQVCMMMFGSLTVCQRVEQIRCGPAGGLVGPEGLDSGSVVAKRVL